MLVRLLQVLWVLSAILFLTFIRGFDETITAILVVWFTALIVTQYLVFGKLNPICLFNGSLVKKSIL